jgi:hypothetical protein
VQQVPNDAAAQLEHMHIKRKYETLQPLLLLHASMRTSSMQVQQSSCCFLQGSC